MDRQAAAGARAPTSGRRPRGAWARAVRGGLVAGAAAAAIAAGAGSGPPAALAAGLSVDLDQWASLDVAWQNGNLNGNNSRYPEGGVIPFRLAIEGLSAGNHTITIEYDFTASGHKAYDFLATWNDTNGPGLCRPSGGAISSRCPNLGTASTFAFPSDSYRANGLRVSAAEAWSGASRRLTIYGGSIQGIGGPVHHGSPDGNSSADFSVRFRSTGAAVLLVWGGHLAQSSFWDTSSGGARDGASMVSGAPWHMRTLNLDGGGARNQDRSIQPSAVVGELGRGALAPTPRPATPRPGAPSTPKPRAQAPGGPSSSGTGSRPTIPPTSTSVPALPARGGDVAIVAGIALVLAGVLSALGGRRRSGRGRRS
jgi:hypothetical protein